MIFHLISASLIILANIADYLSTRYAISKGVGVEWNWLVNKLGLLPDKLIGTAVMLVGSIVASPNVSLAMGIMVVLIYTFIVKSNLSKVK